MVNNHGVLPDLELPNARLPGRIGEDPFHKYLTQNYLRTLYRLTYTYSHHPAIRCTPRVLNQKGNNYFASFFLLYILVSANLASSVSSTISVAGYDYIVIQVDIQQTGKCLSVIVD